MTWNVIHISSATDFGEVDDWSRCRQLTITAHFIIMCGSSSRINPEPRGLGLLPKS